MTITDVLKETYPPPVEVTGEIYVIALHDDFGNVIDVDVEWTGGDIVSITYELLRDANPDILCRDGDTVTLLDYELRVIADNLELETVYLKRQG